VTVAAVDDGRGAVVGWLEDHETWIAVYDGVLAVWSNETRGQRSVHMARLAHR
jgi:hypothetical protein